MPLRRGRHHSLLLTCREVSAADLGLLAQGLDGGVQEDIGEGGVAAHALPALPLGHQVIKTALRGQGIYQWWWQNASLRTQSIHHTSLVVATGRRQAH